MPNTIVSLGTLFPKVDISLCLDKNGNPWPVEVTENMRVVFGDTNWHLPKGDLALLFRDNVKSAPHTAILAGMDERFWLDTKL
jgi:hypothetical protein